MRKIIIPVFVILFLVLQYQLLGGCIKLFYLKKAITQQAAENNRFYKRNTFLEQRVLALQRHQISIEDLAREQLGMIKKGETYYQIIEGGTHVS